MSRRRPPSQRQLRVGEELRHALASIFAHGDLRDPAIAARPVTVTEVRVSPDLKNATVFVSALGGGDDDELLAALHRARPFLRGRLGAEVNLKYTPNLSFARDTSFDEAERINALLRRPDVARDLVPHDEDGEPDGA